jgi:hypothetical protein
VKLCAYRLRSLGQLVQDVQVLWGRHQEPRCGQRQQAGDLREGLLGRRGLLEDFGVSYHGQKFMHAHYGHAPRQRALRQPRNGGARDQVKRVVTAMGIDQKFVSSAIMKRCPWRTD